MPQASDALRAKMEEYFGDPIDDQGPIQLLRHKGHVLTKEWTWKLKRQSQWEALSQQEKDCINFLCDEWDFGGVE